MPEASWMRAILRGCLSTGPGAAAGEDDMLRSAEQRAGEEEESRRLEAGPGEANNRGRERRWRKRERRMVIFEVRQREKKLLVVP